MRLGVCASMISPERDPIGVESAETAAALGFDYLELSLAHMAALSEAGFERLLARVADSGLPCEACNNFFPPTVRLTGPGADLSAALQYARRALARAERLGVEVVVFGSSGAKNVPAGYPLAEARRQLLALLRWLAPLAERHGLTIVLEPISRPEANFINLAGEALELVRELEHPRVRLLVDYYHLVTEGEDPAIIRAAGESLRHLHFATPGDRTFPVRPDGRYDSFFGVLADSEYGGRLSIEAFTGDFRADGGRALEVLRTTLARAGA